jgi:chromosome segregation ATPase
LTQDESTLYDTSKSKHSETPNPVHELSSLKKKYDTVKQENIKKTNYLEWLQGKVYDLKAAAASIQTDMQSFKDRSEEFKVEIEKAKQMLNQELEMKKVYEHMLLRNKTEGTHLDIKVNKFSENVKSAKLQMDIEVEKARKAKDNKFNVKSTLKELKERLDEDTKKKLSNITKLEKNIMKRRDMIRRYDERTKRQADIIELAARQDRKVHEKSIREEITMNKMLFDLLIDKEKAQKTEGQSIEAAFQDIKTRTGFTDPHEILAKFMSREETHTRLIDSVERSEVALDVLKKEYYELKNKLKNLLLVNDGDSFTETAEDEENKMNETYKVLDKVQEQQRKTAIVYEDVCKWSKKLSERLDVKSKENMIENVERVERKIDELIGIANAGKEEFDSGLKRYIGKKTREFVKEIYQEKNSPNKSVGFA